MAAWPSLPPSAVATACQTASSARHRTSRRPHVAECISSDRRHAVAASVTPQGGDVQNYMWLIRSAGIAECSMPKPFGHARFLSFPVG